MVKKALAETYDKHYVSPHFQFIWICLTICILGLILYGPVAGFKSYDETPQIKSLTPKKLIEFGGSPAIVKTGFFIRDFPSYDMVKGEFIIDSTVWFQFDPSIVSVDDIGNFTFEKAEIIHKSQPYKRMKGDELFVRYDTRIKFNIPLNYSFFPLDDHTLSFVLSHKHFSPTDIIFSSARNDLGMAAEYELGGWVFVDKEVKTGFSQDILNNYDKASSVYHPEVIYSLYYNRLGVRHIVSIVLPLLIIFFITLFSFTIDPYGQSSGDIRGLSIAGITAIIGFRFVIESMAPQVGYSMLSDHLFLFFLLVTCVIFLINFFGQYAREVSKKIIVSSLHLATMGAFAYWILG